MKKLFALTLLTMLVALSMVVCAGATEYVYYENDFSDAATISDFTQYRGEWTIEDGALKLTGAGKFGPGKQVFILYTADDAIMNLTDYVLEFEVTPNAFAGVLARCDKNLAYADSETGFCGYRMAMDYVTKTSDGSVTEKFSLGRTNTAGGWLGDLGGFSMASQRNSVRYVTVTVEGPNVSVVITDADGMELWNHTAENDEWAMGTFGFCALPMDMSASMANIDMLKFDNLKVTAIGDVGTHLANGGKLADYVPTVASNPVTVEKVAEKDVDFTKTEYVLYENDFSDPATIEHFTQARGTWVIQDGKLYLESNLNDDGVENTFSFIAYTADETGYVGKVSDYTIEADLYDVATSAGIISYVDTDLFSGDSDNSFYGYLSFVGNGGNLVALGYADTAGGWGGNIKVSPGGTIVPGNDYHIVVRHLDGKVYFSFTDIETGALAYEFETTADKWTTGSFGFRMRGVNVDKSNLMTAAFDNLKVTVTGSEAALIHAGYAPNSEIVYEAVVAPVDDTPETTTAVTTAPVADNGGGSISGVVIAVIAAGVVVIGAVVAVVVKKKNANQ